MSPKDTGLASKRILVADDEPAIRLLLVRFLEQLGYSVRTAEDGIKACEAVETEIPDLILLDLLLPRKDGYAVLLHLRSNPATAETPVLFVSGESPGEHVEISRTMGAQGFLSKPFSFEGVAAAVLAALKDRSERKVES